MEHGASSQTTEVRGQKSEGRRLLGTKDYAPGTNELRNQRSEVRSQRKGYKLISDIRLLASGIDDFN